MNGNIQLRLEQAGWRCDGDLVLANVAYQPVYDSYVARRSSDQLRKDLGDFRANRRVHFDCDGLNENARFGLVPYLQAAATREAVQDAPKAVRAVAPVEAGRTHDGVAGEEDVPGMPGTGGAAPGGVATPGAVPANPYVPGGTRPATTRSASAARRRAALRPRRRPRPPRSRRRASATS
jgi:hypothetical protein